MILPLSFPFPSQPLPTIPLHSSSSPFALSFPYFPRPSFPSISPSVSFPSFLFHLHLLLFSSSLHVLSFLFLFPSLALPLFFPLTLYFFSFHSSLIFPALQISFLLCPLIPLPFLPHSLHCPLLPFLLPFLSIEGGWGGYDTIMVYLYCAQK